MDAIDDALRTHFRPEAPAGLTTRLQRRLKEVPAKLVELADRLDVEATPQGVTLVALRRPGERGRVRGGSHAERAHAELREFLGGRRAFFSVAADLSKLGAFQQRVLTEALRIPFGEVTSYATLAARVGQPRAARAVGNALAANPVPLIVPCHRVIRGDGTWGRYGLGDPLKTQLLGLERSIPTLVGCTTTRIVCRRGCPHEQRMGEDRRIVFASVPDAVSVGYRPCQVCRPRAA
jgi:O-6-methylguanine DNA methyltransferase